MNPRILNHGRMGRAVALVLVLVAGRANAQVEMSYGPTTIDPGVATDVTMSLTNLTGEAFGIGAIVVVLDAPAGMTISNVRWLGGLNDPSNFLIGTMLPDGVDVVLDGSAGTVTVADGATLDVLRFRLLVDDSLSGTQQTLVIFPEGPNSAVADDDGFFEFVIDAGRSVTFSITGEGSDTGDGMDSDSGGDSGSGGGSDGGGSGGDSGGDSGGSDGMDGSDGGTDGGGMDGDGSDGGADSGGTDGDGAGDDGVGGDGTVIDPDGDGGADGVGGSDGGGDDGSGSGGSGSGDGGGNGGESSDEGGTSGGNAGGRAPSFCGVGMIQVGVFTLGFMSVMKGWSRRRRFFA